MGNQDLHQYIEQIILQLGFSYKHHGTTNLIDAIVICCLDPDALSAVTKRVYPVLARREGTVWKNVARNMRTAIEGCWKRGDRQRLCEMAGFRLLVEPTPGEIINYVVAYVRKQDSFHKRFLR